MKFRDYFKNSINEETVSGDISHVTPKLNLGKKCPKCGSTSYIMEKCINGSTRCKNCNYKAKHEEFVPKDAQDATDNPSITNEAENKVVGLLRKNKIKIKNIRDGKFGTEIDLFKIPDNIDIILGDFKYDLKDKTIFVMK
jgi:ribosomal protein L37AE/L43A